mmetsp:Transcript_16161/g.44773  ORF Transcript_16161/g.44773 Transcript_16161/m.44773 type:complete len:162 (-) Transcript_16161:497-982(-)
MRSKGELFELSIDEPSGEGKKNVGCIGARRAARARPDACARLEALLSKYHHDELLAGDTARLFTPLHDDELRLLALCSLLDWLTFNPPTCSSFLNFHLQYATRCRSIHVPFYFHIALQRCSRLSSSPEFPPRPTDCRQSGSSKMQPSLMYHRSRTSMKSRC